MLEHMRDNFTWCYTSHMHLKAMSCWHASIQAKTNCPFCSHVWHHFLLESWSITCVWQAICVQFWQNLTPVRADSSASASSWMRDIQCASGPAPGTKAVHTCVQACVLGWPSEEGVDSSLYHSLFHVWTDRPPQSHADKDHDFRPAAKRGSTTAITKAIMDKANLLTLTDFQDLA